MTKTLVERLLLRIKSSAWGISPEHSAIMLEAATRITELGSAISAKSAPRGEWRMVPVDITPEMRLAGLRALVEHVEANWPALEPVKDGDELTESQMARRYMRLGAAMRNSNETDAAYRAILAAAPSPPSDEGSER